MLGLSIKYLKLPGKLVCSIIRFLPLAVDWRLVTGYWRLFNLRLSQFTNRIDAGLINLFAQ